MLIEIYAIIMKYCLAVEMEWVEPEFSGQLSKKKKEKKLNIEHKTGSTPQIISQKPTNPSTKYKQYTPDLNYSWHIVSIFIYSQHCIVYKFIYICVMYI